MRIGMVLCSILLLGASSSVLGQVPAPIHGVTVEDTHDVTTEPFQSQVVTALGNLTVGPTTRIVFTPPRPAGDYQAATARISTVSYIMGMPVDSSSMSSISVANYLTRFEDYVTTLGSNVDIWEICNECNGDWLGKSSDVAAKLAEAYDYVKGQGKVAALTLYQFPTLKSSCVSNPSYDMLTWTGNDSNVPQRIKQGVDYVLVSYYNDSCSPSQPEPNWQTLFANLSAIFPNSKVGFGEVGWSTNTPPSVQKRKTLINHFYRLHKNFPITVPNYVDGYFYWEFSWDMVPWTKQLWGVINTAMTKQ
jgi:hypothetical protein